MYDYRYEPHRVIFMIDNKSFFASCEALRLGLNPMMVPLVVLSRPEAGKSALVMAASPVAKSKYGLKTLCGPKTCPAGRKHQI